MTDRKPVTLELPYPPTVNTYWRMGRGRMYIAKKGIDFRNSVVALVGHRGLKARNGNLDVRVSVYPPDRRKRDLDNVLKALFDSLFHAGVYNDDSQIKRIDAEMLDKVKGGKTVVTIIAYRRGS